MNGDGLLRVGENTLRVECDNVQQPESRWYTGAGIYRPVWMWEGPADCILPEGIRVKTLSHAPAEIWVQVECSCKHAHEVRIEIKDGERIAANGVLGADGLHLPIPDAVLWDEAHPKLYRCCAQLIENGAVVDTAETLFGIRTVAWSAKGLFINGKSTLLRGGCIHHDSGILGAATYDESEYRRIRRLKKAGYNAIRSSHNPASRAMLEACDALGVYVIDEGWDMWFHHKNTFDYASQWREHYEADLRAMVAKDYNHPSVLFYSIGNEVSEPAKPEGLAMIRKMTELLHQLDDSRAVTGGFNLMILKNSQKGKGVYKEEGGMQQDTDKGMSGMNSTMFNLITSMVGTSMNKSANSKAADLATAPALDLLDIAGYNYASGRYPLEGAAHPDRVIFGSETFPQTIVKNWEMVERYPYLIGDFMWTAWDYLGEAGVGAWAYTPDSKGFNKPYPWLLADCGALDILGNPGAPAFLARAAWKLDETPQIAVQPVNHPGVKPIKGPWRGSNGIASWAWQGCDGNRAIVEVYSSAARVELLLNGKSLGRKALRQCKATFKTKYAEGTLEAVAYDAQGRETGRSRLCSAKGKVAPKILPEKTVVHPGEVCYVDICMADESGTVESNHDELLSVRVEGGELLAFGSANPRTEERFDTGSYTSYYGRTLAVIRAGESGHVHISVQGASGLASVGLSIR